MTQQTLAEVMTRTVVTVSTMTPTPVVVALLARHGIGGVPVLDDAGRPLGVISEGDLLAWQRKGPARSTGVWLDWMPAPEQRGAASAVAAELMSTAETVTPQMHVDDAARLLLTADRRRLLVVDAAGRLVGIVTRGDLLRALTAPEHRASGGGAVDLTGEISQERVRMPLAEMSAR